MRMKTPTDIQKKKAAATLGSLGGSATAKIPGQMKKISKIGVQARWGKKKV